jgi:hypothetical protein
MMMHKLNSFAHDMAFPSSLIEAAYNSDEFNAKTIWIRIAAGLCRCML